MAKRKTSLSENPRNFLWGCLLLPLNLDILWLVGPKKEGTALLRAEL